MVTTTKTSPTLATTHLRTLLQLCLLAWDRLVSTLLSMFSLIQGLIDLLLRRLFLIPRDLVLVARMSLVNDSFIHIGSLVYRRIYSLGLEVLDRDIQVGCQHITIASEVNSGSLESKREAREAYDKVCPSWACSCGRRYPTSSYRSEKKFDDN
jgi:hypothetical protein